MSMMNIKQSSRQENLSKGHLRWYWIMPGLYHMYMNVYITYIHIIIYSNIYTYMLEQDMNRADSRFAPSQWETLLQSTAVSHWLGSNLGSISSALTSSVGSVFCIIFIKYTCMFYRILPVGQESDQLMVYTAIVCFTSLMASLMKHERSARCRASRSVKQSNTARVVHFHRWPLWPHLEVPSGRVNRNHWQSGSIKAQLIDFWSTVESLNNLMRFWFQEKIPRLVQDGWTFLNHFDGLVQERLNSIANALELHLSCTNPSIWYIG